MGQLTELNNGNGNRLLARSDDNTTLAMHDNAQQQMVIQEIRGAMLLAQQFPRDEDNAAQQIQKSCRRYSFAESAQYSFPRGQTTVKGPSVYFAREFARIWGNIRHGYDVIADDKDNRTIRAWAWDLETNTKVSADDTFKKLIYRKNRGWVEPDERDLRELTNRRAAILKRNCILELLPSDMVEDALHIADQTLVKKITDDPDQAKKSAIAAFGELNIPAKQVKEYLGCAVEHATPKQLAELREIYSSIKRGENSWSDYYQPETEDKPKSMPTGKQSLKKEPAKEQESEAKEAKPDPKNGKPDDNQDKSWIPDFMDDMKTRIDEAKTEIELKAIQAEYGSMKDLGMDLIDELDALCTEIAKEKGF